MASRMSVRTSVARDAGFAQCRCTVSDLDPAWPEATCLVIDRRV
jgi:hypothetical protein